MKKKAKISHTQYALAYLRGGNAIGGRTVEALVKDAADAIDPSCDTVALRGIGPALGNVRAAIVLLCDAYGELSAALAEHQARFDAPRRRR